MEQYWHNLMVDAAEVSSCMVDAAEVSNCMVDAAVVSKTVVVLEVPVESSK